MEDRALRLLKLKTEQAKKGNDWVLDSHSMSSCQLLELVAIARLGHPVWMAQGRSSQATSWMPDDEQDG